MQTIGSADQWPSCAGATQRHPGLEIAVGDGKDLCFASIAFCTFVPVLLLIPRTAFAPHGGLQHPTPAVLKEEIEGGSC